VGQESQNQNKSQNEKVIPLKGLIVDFDLPSTALLDVAFDLKFEDRKIGREVVKVVTKYFYNKLKTISRLLYTKINEFAIKTPFGYVVSFNDIERLHALAERVRKELVKFDEELRDFVKYGKIPDHLAERLEKKGVLDEYLAELREYRKIIDEYLRSKGTSFEEVANAIPPLYERFRVKTIPIYINFEEIEELLPERARKIAQEMIMETASRIKAEVEAKLRKEAEQQIEQLKQFIVENMNRIKKSLLEGKLKSALEHIEKIINKTYGLGVESRKIEEIREKLKSIIDEVAKSREEDIVEPFRLKLLLNKLTTS